MPQYIRAFVPGGTFFLTVTLLVFIDAWNAAFIPLTGLKMITFEVYRWNNAKGGMRYAFPPYGLIAKG